MASSDSATAEVQEAADRIAFAIGAKYPSLIEGLAMPGRGELEITTSVPVPADARDLMASLAKGVPLTFRLVANSAETLNDLTRQITADLGYWRSVGVDMSSWGPDYASNKVVVTLTAYTAARAALIAAKYAGQPVAVSTTSMPHPSR